eukprot:TRINITY_DN1_c17_g1_i1.p1 TRINITY_DN1_c17_g1~~TRINITY_DN1_c17_g1_i1.p1  ORF type:complete len:735 (+),score=278.38 TRINITY_DN1_c17_g1_i1:34-2205(+)
MKSCLRLLTPCRPAPSGVPVFTRQHQRQFESLVFLTCRGLKMASPSEEELKAKLQSLQEQQVKAGDHVRLLKQQKAPLPDINAAVEALKNLKLQVEEATKALKPKSDKIDFNRAGFSKMLTQRFFLTPSFEIYGGVAGLYDLGPPGCAIKANLLAQWRQHFVLTENMLEVDCTSVTPDQVLAVSGHKAKFSDLMVKDTVNGNCFRADHLLEQHLEKLLEAKGVSAELAHEIKNVIAQADALSIEAMGECIKKYNVCAPDTGNAVSHPEPFNLMFATQIGPTGKNPGFLRPETAQGIFINFKRLLEYNGGRLPFAAAQIGQAFRNEIAPRSGLLRVREFTLAEIEHFVNTSDKSHPKFAGLADTVLTLFPRDQQTTTHKPIEITIGEAVKQKIVDNETLGYFIVRTYLFLTSVGIKRDRLRFRQHLRDEMAHYATDCWDAEIQNSYGWTECVGIADRSAFDLTAHSAATKEPLVAFVEYKDGHKQVELLEVKLDNGLIGRTYKAKAKPLQTYLGGLSEAEAEKLNAALEADGKATVTVGSDSFEVTKPMISFARVQKRVTGENITPGVIEPSFGIGRILYSLLEHAFWTREGDEQRGVLSLPPTIAPVKVSVLPLLANNPALHKPVPRIVNLLQSAGISTKLDDSGVAIGRKYARTDEIGIPFGITIDHTTVEDDTITVRERDSQQQIRVKIDEVGDVISKLIDGRLLWADVYSKYPQVKVALE